MEVLTFTENQISKLSKLKIPKEILNTESQIYILDHGKWNYCDGSLLIKRLYIDNGDSMANKLYNVSLLSDNKDKIGIDELVIPRHLVAIKKQVKGFTVPRLEGENLGVIFNNTKIDNEKKLEYLHKVGKLLKKTQNLRINGIKFNFGDLHEYNFLVDKDSNIHAVDMDSCYLGTKNPQPSYYLNTNKVISYFTTKYKKNQQGIYYPNNNSDLLCYNMMILNTIARDMVSKYDISLYYEYICYLKDLGFGDNIIRSFKNLYSSAKNINPCDYLDEIPLDKIGEAGAKVFKYKKERGKI